MLHLGPNHLNKVICLSEAGFLSSLDNLDNSYHLVKMEGVNKVMNEKEWLSIKEACEFLGVSESTMRRRIKDKKVIAEKITNENGQQWFILSQSLQGYKGHDIGQTLPTLKEFEGIQKALLLTTHKAIKDELSSVKEELQFSISNEVGQLVDMVQNLQDENKQLLQELQTLREEKKRPLLKRLFRR